MRNNVGGRAERKHCTPELVVVCSKIDLKKTKGFTRVTKRYLRGRADEEGNGEGRKKEGKCVSNL